MKFCWRELFVEFFIETTVENFLTRPKLCVVSFTVFNASASDTVSTRSPVVASMADHTAPVVKLTLTLTLKGHNLAKTRHFPLKRANYEAK